MTQPPEAGDLRSKITDIVLEAIQNAASGEASDSGYLDRDHANDAADRILSLSPAPSQGDVELRDALENIRTIAEHHWFCAAAIPADDKSLVFLGKAFEEIKDTARAAIAAMPVSAGYRVALVEAAIPLEAMLIAGVDHMSPEMQEGIRNAVRVIRAALSDDDGK